MSSQAARHLTVEEASKDFGDTRAVIGASLSVPRGKTMALLGPSGCGKTTLLRMIAGLTSPDAGRVWLAGRNLVGVKPERRHIGMVFHGGALFPHMSVAENVAYGLDRRSRKRERVEAALELVHLSGFSDRRPATLSAGQAQRVAIARALAPEPEVLLLDEPFAALDAELRVRIRAEIAALLNSLEITALFVTHDQEEAFVVGDLIAVMRDGRILQVGTPTGIYQKPESPWIASFVGEANVIEGIGRGTTAETLVGTIPLATELRGPCRLIMRPEHLSIDTGDDGTVASIEFYGHDTAYRIAVNGSRLIARTLAAPHFSVGDTVSLRYAGPGVMAFATNGSSPTAGS